MNPKLRRSPSGPDIPPSIVSLGKKLGPASLLTVPGGGTVPQLPVVELDVPVPPQDCALLVQALCTWTGDPDSIILSVSLNTLFNLRATRGMDSGIHLWEWSTIILSGDAGLVRPSTKVILGVGTPGPTGTIIGQNAWELRVLVLTGFDVFSIV